jgi:hypothetical protein
MVKAVFDKDLTQADGFDWDTRYQMVPFQGRRGGFHVDSADEALEVTFEPPGIARFEARIFIPPGVSVSDFAIAVPPRTSLRFEMVGVKHGNATMVVHNPAGKPLAHLLVSVKKEIPKTYSICMLRDMVHLSPWSEQKLRPIMQRVHSCFLRQANIRLSERTSTIFQINVSDRNLGGPIVLDKKPVPGNKSVAEIIKLRTPENAKSADFVIYFTWAIRHVGKDFVGLNSGASCYVEFNRFVEEENFLTTAHEIGHALGLDHSAADLMAGDGSSRSAFLKQFEIDMANRTDEDP